MKAILRTYHSETNITEEVVEISDDHHFEDGPYVDTIPFSVCSNQAIVPLDEARTIPIEKFHELLGEAYAVCVDDTLYYVGYDDNDEPYIADNDGQGYVSLAKIDGDIEVIPFGLFFHVKGMGITMKFLSVMDIKTTLA